MADLKLSQQTAAGALTGSELAYVVQGGNSRRTTLAAIVALAAGTNLTYDAATRLLASSTGADVTLPLATDALDGLMSAAHRALSAALIDAGVMAAGSTVTIPHIHGDIAGSLYIHVKNLAGVQLTKGTPVRVVGAVGDTSTLEVAAADAASAGTMPAIGILSDTLAINATGHAVVAGELLGMATGSYSVGQALYVASGGGLTATKPTSGTIQQVAIVGRVNASTGSITVTIAGMQSPNWDTAYSERLRWDGGATGLDAATGRTSLGLGNAAQGTIGTAAGNVVALDGSARLPAVDGSQLTGLPSAPVTSVAGRTGAITLAVGDIANAAASGAITGSGLTMATARLLGRSTASTGAVEELTVGTGLSLSGGTLSATATGSGTKTISKFKVRENQSPAANFATLDTRNGVSVLEFDAAADEIAIFVDIISEGTNLSSGVTVFVWFWGDTATSGNVRWEFAIERMNTDIDADSFDTAGLVTTTTTSTSGVAAVAQATITAIDGVTAGDPYRLRICRRGTDATNDTMTGDAQLFAVEVRGVA